MSDLIQVVRVHDPAFESLGWDALKPYSDSRDMADLPTLPPGASPVVFHCRLLTRSQVKWVEMVQDGEERFARAFAAGVVKITGGRFGEGWEPSNAREANRVAMPEQEIEDQRIARLDEKDVGQVIYMRSTVPFDCSLRFLPLHGSLVAFDGNARRYAERTRASAHQSSVPPKAP